MGRGVAASGAETCAPDHGRPAAESSELARGEDRHVRSAGMRSPVTPKSAELMSWQHEKPQNEGGRWRGPEETRGHWRRPRGGGADFPFVQKRCHFRGERMGRRLWGVTQRGGLDTGQVTDGEV